MFVKMLAIVTLYDMNILTMFDLIFNKDDSFFSEIVLLSLCSSMEEAKLFPH